MDDLDMDDILSMEILPGKKGFGNAEVPKPAHSLRSLHRHVDRNLRIIVSEIERMQAVLEAITPVKLTARQRLQQQRLRRAHVVPRASPLSLMSRR